MKDKYLDHLTILRQRGKKIKEREKRERDVER